MTTKCAGDIMIPIDKYPHVLHSLTLRETIEKMESSAIVVGGRMSLPRVVLVFDEEYHPLGIVRRRDILRGLEPKFLRTMAVPHRKKLFDIEVDPNLADFSSGKIAEAIRTQAEQPVSEVMNPIGATVNYDDLLAKIIYKMLSRDVYMLPVLKDNRVVGVVRTVDVFHEVANLLK
jgi:predicted transcriptional regulator